jgi:hypothetical protein
MPRKKASTKKAPVRKARTKKSAGASAVVAVGSPSPDTVTVEVPSAPIRSEQGTFLPGASGNPKGRPPGTRNWITIERENLELALRQYMGRPDQRNKLLAAVDRLINITLNSEDDTAVKAMKILFDKVLPSPKPADEAVADHKPSVHITIENATQDRGVVVNGEFSDNQ